MKNSTFTIDQITKLRDLERSRMKAGGQGLRADIQALIVRLQVEETMRMDEKCDTRLHQARVLWNKGFGHVLGFATFDAYLATIPKFSSELDAYDVRFPCLILVDARLSITKSCTLLSVDYSGDDQTFRDFDPKKAKTEKVYWIRCQDGKKNKGISVETSRMKFLSDELGLTANEGLAVFAQIPETFRNHGMHLPGSVLGISHERSACLHWLEEGPELRWLFSDNPVLVCGSGSRRI